MAAEENRFIAPIRTISKQHRPNSLLKQLEVHVIDGSDGSYPSRKNKGLFATRQIRAGTFIAWFFTEEQCDEKVSMINDPCVNLTSVLEAKTHSAMYMALVDLKHNYRGQANVEVVRSTADGKSALYSKSEIKRGDEILRRYELFQWFTELLDILNEDTVIGYCFFLRDFIQKPFSDMGHRFARQLERQLLHLLNINDLCCDESTSNDDESAETTVTTSSPTSSSTTRYESNLDILQKLYDGRKFNYTFEAMKKISDGSHIMVSDESGQRVMKDLNDVLASSLPKIDQELILFENIIYKAKLPIIWKVLHDVKDKVYWGLSSFETLILNKSIADLRALLANMLKVMVLRCTITDLVGIEPKDSPFPYSVKRDDINAALKMLLSHT